MCIEMYIYIWVRLFQHLLTWCTNTVYILVQSACATALYSSTFLNKHYFSSEGVYIVYFYPIAFLIIVSTYF